MDYTQKSVGQIVAADFATAEVFRRFGIDFCCHGEVKFTEACRAAGVSPEDVIKALEAGEGGSCGYGSAAPNFNAWPLDLLIDYVLKIHHRTIRREGPQTLDLLDKVVKAHGDRHPELHEVRALFAESLGELDAHLGKEEEVLFPYVLELFEASEAGHRQAPMHCGTVANPIRVMKMEHEGEGVRHARIAELTNNYTAPEDACGSYRLVLERLRDFEQALHEHIHIENNIIFPRSVELEARCVAW